MNRGLLSKIIVLFFTVVFIFGCGKKNSKELQQKVSLDDSFSLDSLTADSTRSIIIPLPNLPEKAKKLES